jgi:arylsulfatase A-like enzyme
MRMRAAMGAWLSLTAVLLAFGCGSELPSRPNIFLLTVESLRPDHMGSYTGERDTTPNLDAFARESVVYEDAHSVTSWTLASHASMFTGLYPTAHGAVESRSRLDGEIATLADLLAQHGYQTAGFASGPYLARRHNLSQGFEYYDDSPATVGTQGGAHDDVTNPSLESAIIHFLFDRRYKVFDRYRDPERPLFLFAYYWDPHYDYIPPPPFNTMFVEEGAERIGVRGYESSGLVTSKISPAELSYVLSQYDGEIRFTDFYLGRFFEVLKKAGLWENSVVIVTSDHGEEFFDHGKKGHKNSLYSESVHVPLIIKHPRSARTGRDSRLVSLVDLFPTILELAGAEVPSAHQAMSLLDLDPDPDRSIFFELLSTLYHRLTDGEGFVRDDEEWLAVRRGDSKLVVVPADRRIELYRVSTDRGEQEDIAGDEPQMVADLQSTLDAFREESRLLAQGGGEEQADLDPEQIERLRELGYLERPPEDEPQQTPASESQ